MTDKCKKLIDRFAKDMETTGKLTSIDIPDTWNQTGIQVLWAAIGQNPETVHFSTMICILEYNSHVYLIHFTIYSENGICYLSSIEEMIYRIDNDYTECDWLDIKPEGDVFGRAAWDNTPDCILTEPDEIAMRTLTNKLTAYCHKNGITRKLGKLAGKNAAWKEQKH